MSVPDPLGAFDPLIATYFAQRFPQPTPAQALGWPAIRSGQDTLVVAPTGSGKTLAAFLVTIDDLLREGPRAAQGIHTLYVSPLRALSHDIQRSLQLPLQELEDQARSCGRPWRPIDVGVRTADTTASRRRAMARRPPDILVTTPESLFLMLMANLTRPALAGVRRVIVDEVHALASTKRGTLLALSLELLDHLAGRPIQRIGLSATVRPPERAAAFLAGARDGGVRIVDAGARRSMDLQVILACDPAPGRPEADVWQAIARRLLEFIDCHASTLVFVNNRRQSERLTHLLNQIAGTRLALTHHGSMARSSRLYVEQALKAGELRAVVATGTLELGIDVGFIDLVVHVESPPQVSQGLQRVGRSGHAVLARSKGRILPKHPSDLLEAAACARAIASFDIEPLHVPRMPLDVLAQFVAGLSTLGSWKVADILALVRRAMPFTELAPPVLEEVLGLLAGDVMTASGTGARPRIAWDRAAGTVTAMPSTRPVLFLRAGTIPDRGQYPVYLAGTDVRLGELDEEFVYESRRGDVFWLGMGAWRIDAIRPDRVLVSRAPGSTGKLPFWRGEGLSRSTHLGAGVARLLREMERLLATSGEEGCRRWLEQECHLEPAAAVSLAGYVARQAKWCGALPCQGRVVVESFPDELGDLRVAIHSPWGRRVNQAWATVMVGYARRRFGVEADSAVSDDGILLRFPKEKAVDTIAMARVEGEDPLALLDADLPGSPLVARLFREAAGRALLITRARRGQRLPLWQQRLRAADLMLEQVSRSGGGSGPLLREAIREAKEDVLDAAAMARLIDALRDGTVALHAVTTPAPSPFAVSLSSQFTGTYLYEPDAPKAERQAATRMGSAEEALREAAAAGTLPELLRPDAVQEVLRRRATPPWLAGRPITTAEDLEQLLAHRGDLSPAELDALFPGASERGLQLMETLERSGRARRIGALWVHPGLAVLVESVRRAGAHERAQALTLLLERRSGQLAAFTARDVAARYGVPVEDALRALEELAHRGGLIAGSLGPGEPSRFVDTGALVEMRRRSAWLARQDAEPVDPGSFALFLARRHGLAGGHRPGVDQAIDLLAGLWAPLETWLGRLLVPRVGPEAREALADAVASGRVGYRCLPAVDSGRVPDVGTDVTFFLRGQPPGPLLLAAARTEDDARERDEQPVCEVLAAGGSWFAWEIAARTGLPAARVELALAHLVRQGVAGAESLEFLEQLVARGSARRPEAFGEAAEAPARAGEGIPRGLRPFGSRAAYLALDRRRRLQARLRARQAAYRDAGAPSRPVRFFAASPASEEGPQLARAWASVLLRRYGVVAREMASADGCPLPWSFVADALDRAEARGEVVRGYFVEGFSGEQFAEPGAVDALREARSPAEQGAWVAAALDPVLLPLRAAAPPPWWPHPSSFSWVGVVGRRAAVLLRPAMGALWFDPEAPDVHLREATAAILGVLQGGPGYVRRVALRRIQGLPVGKALSQGCGAWLHEVGFVRGPRTWEYYPS